MVGEEVSVFIYTEPRRENAYGETETGEPTELHAQGVLVLPISTQDAADKIHQNTDVQRYRLAFRRDFEDVIGMLLKTIPEEQNIWDGAYVVFHDRVDTRGYPFRVIGSPQISRPNPTLWSMLMEVTRDV